MRAKRRGEGQALLLSDNIALAALHHAHRGRSLTRLCVRVCVRTAAAAAAAAACPTCRASGAHDHRARDAPAGVQAAAQHEHMCTPSGLAPSQWDTQRVFYSGDSERAFVAAMGYISSGLTYIGVRVGMLY